MGQRLPHPMTMRQDLTHVPSDKCQSGPSFVPCFFSFILDTRVCALKLKAEKRWKMQVSVRVWKRKGFPFTKGSSFVTTYWGTFSMSTLSTFPLFNPSDAAHTASFGISPYSFIYFLFFSWFWIISPISVNNWKFESILLCLGMKLCNEFGDERSGCDKEDWECLWQQNWCQKDTSRNQTPLSHGPW